MDKRVTFFVFGVLFSTLCLSQNLIINWTFEDNNGNKRCDGWFDACGEELSKWCDTMTLQHCGGSFYNDAPVDGGNWSLLLTSLDPPVNGYAETYIVIPEDGNYQLSMWMKIGQVGGSADLYKKTGGQTTFWGNIIADTTEWKYYQKTLDSLTAADSIVLRIGAAPGNFVLGRLYVDLVELLKWDDVVCCTSSLIENCSFEDTTLLGWRNEYCGSAYVQDPSPAGGDFALQLPFGNFQGCFPSNIYQVIPSVQNGEVYKLSAWVKNEGFPLTFGASISIGKKTTSGIIEKNIRSDTTTSYGWILLEVEDTFILDAGDTAVAILEAGSVTGIGSGNTLFDMVCLEKVNDPTNVITIRKNEQIVKVFQRDREQLIVTSKKSEIKNIKLLQLDGKGIMDKKCNSKQEELNIQKFSNGMYVLIVELQDGFIYKQKIFIP